jgi:hypothetical protein
MPVMNQVESSNIHSVGYDDETQTLHVRFKSGNKTYVYEDVPKSEYDNMLDAESVGRHFHNNIKGQYKEKNT